MLSLNWPAVVLVSLNLAMKSTFFIIAYWRIDKNLIIQKSPFYAMILMVFLDVVIGATTPDGCIEFIKRAKANDFMPNALILSNCINDRYIEELGEDGR